MKKIGLLSIIGCSVSGAAIAAGVDCSVIPTCVELGYTKSVADCEGQIILRCPFEITNDNAVFCQDKSSASAPSEPVIGQGCDAVGDILYNDLNCYTTAPSGKTAIGVVFDTTNKLAMGLTHASSTMSWWSSNEDVSGLENCTDESTVKTTCGTSGKTNSAALVAAGYTDASDAAGYCYNQTTGGLAKGDWFLPSLKELNTIYTNKSTISSAITSAGGTTISSGYHWSSTEYSSKVAWLLYMYDGYVGNDNKNFGSGYVLCAISYAGGGNGDDNEESCSSDYSLDTCPTNGVCSECGGKKKLDSCTEGYELQDGACVAATPVTGQGCTSVGSILYNDLNCYTTAPSGKTVIGVVFDTTNKLAIGLTRTSLTWGGYGTDITTMTNCSSSNATTTCDTDGKVNTSRIVAALGSGTNYAAAYCYNQTTGGLAKGDWFLPSLKELNTIYTNKSTINTAITSAGGTTISSWYWSSTEYSSGPAWGLNMSDGRVLNYDKSGNDYVRCAVAY